MDFAWFTIGLFVSLLAAAHVGPRVHAFTWERYGAIVGICIFWVALAAYLLDARIFAIYIASCVAGAFVEYIFGYIWHMTMGHRLWEYWRYTLGGYTSLLVLPLWGVAGVFFYLLARLFAV